MTLGYVVISLWASSMLISANVIMSFCFSVREWIECMQVCCQSRTTTSSPRNVTATATPTNFTAPATPTVFSTVYPQLLYTVGSAAYLPGHALPSLVPLPSYWDYRSPLVATQQSLLVDAGYASAQSSPTATAAVHSLMVSASCYHGCLVTMHVT